MKNPIKEFIKNNYISKLSYPEIIAAIQDKKEQINALKDEIVLLSKESSDLDDKYSQSINDLDKRREDFFKHLDSDLNRLKRESEKTEAAIVRLNNSHEQEIEEINSKIEAATAEKKQQFQQLLAAKQADYNHQKNELLEQLDKLHNAQSDQLKIFDNSFNELNKQYTELLKNLESEQTTLKNTLQEEETRLATEQQKLNQQLKQAKTDHQTDLENLSLQTKEQTNNLQKENDSNISLLRGELSSLIKEVETLTLSRDRLKKELSDKQKKTAEDYETKSDIFEIQKQQAEALNSDLSKRIELKKAEYQQADKDYRDLLKHKNNFFELFLAMSKDEGSTEDKELVAKLTKQPEYQDFIAQLEKTNTQKKLLNEELTTLNYRLSTEQEQLQSRLGYFDERIANRKQELTQKIAQMQQTNAQLEQEITTIQKDYLVRIDRLKAELDETLAANKTSFKQAEDDYKLRLDTLKSKYLQECDQLNCQIKDITVKVNDLQEENVKLEAELTALKKQSQEKLAYLKEKQEAFVKKAQQSKELLNQQLKELNDERFKTIEELKRTQKELIDKEAEKNLLDYNSQKEMIEKALADLANTKSAQYAEFNKTLASIEKEYSELISQLDDKNKDLQQQYSELLERYQQEINGYEEAIATDNSTTVSNIQTLESEKKNELDSIAKTARKELADANEQLSAANSNYAALSKQKEDLLAEISATEEDKEEQLAKLNVRYENERTAIELELADLKLTLKSKEDYFLKEKQYCDQKLSELYNLHCSQEKELQDLADQNEKQLKETHANLANELSAYVADLYAVFNSKQNQFAQDLKILQLRLDKENEQQSARNAYLQTKLENKRKEYENRIDSLNRSNNELENNLVELQKESEAKLSKLFEEKMTALQANETAIREKKNANEEEKAAYKAELDEAVAQIISEKHNVEKMAADLAKECAIKRGELDTKRSAAVRQIIDLNAEQKEYIEKINAEIADTKEAIAELQAENVEVIAEKQEKIADFDGQEQSAVLAHLEKKKQLADEYHQHLNELQQQHSAMLVNAEQEHQLSLKRLQEENDERLARIEANAHIVETSLIQERQELEYSIVKLDEELENKLNESACKRQEIQLAIEQADADYQQLYLEHQTKMSIIQEEYQSRLEQLQQERDTELEDIQKKGDKEISDLEAEVLKAKTKIQQLNGENAYYDAQLQLIDVDFENKAKDIQTKRSEKQEVFEELSSKYVALKKLCDEEYQQLNAELLAKQAALAEFKHSQDQELENIRLHQLEIIDSIVKRNEHHLNEQKKAYDAENLKAKELCDLRIKEVKEQLEQAKIDLQEYKETVEQKRKQKQELFDQQYQKVVEAKEKLEQELAFTKADYENKLQLCNDAYKRREGEVNRVLNSFEEANTKALDDSRAALQTKYQGLKAEYDAVQQQLAELNKKKQELIDGLSTYRNRKNEELQQLSIDCNDKTQEVIAQIQNIFEMKTQLADLHKERITTIKQQIVATAEEYDFATKNHSATLAHARSKEAEDAKEILAAKTKEFKEKLLQLENNHQDTLRLLNDLSEETIAQLAKDIQDVKDNRVAEANANKLKLTTISESYGLMINQEKERILALRKEISGIKESLSKKKDENISFEQQLEDYFKTRKQEIDEHSLAQREQLAEEFRLKMMDESLKLADSKSELAKLNEEILKLNQRYEEVDQQLLKERDGLLLTYAKQIEEAGKAYEEAAESYRKKRQADDKVSGVINSLFKKH